MQIPAVFKGKIIHTDGEGKEVEQEQEDGDGIMYYTGIKRSRLFYTSVPEDKDGNTQYSKITCK